MRGLIACDVTMYRENESIHGAFCVLFHCVHTYSF